MHEIKVNITGNVQRVMFRDFVKRYAQSLGLCGVVKNLDNGSVEAVVQGDKDSLETLIKYLHEGPFLAQVVYIGVKWQEPNENFDSFTIQY